MNPTITQLRDEIDEYITSDDIEEYFGEGALSKYIVKYGDLDNYASITNLLPKKKDFRILLLEDTPNSGHWVAVLRNGKTLEYFNSYGLKPSRELDYNTDLVNTQLDQDTRHLNILLKKALDDGFNVVYNKRQFQKMADGVATCGKHVILRIVMFQTKGYNLPQYISFFDEVGKRLKLSNDLLVTYLVRKHRD